MNFQHPRWQRNTFLCFSLFVLLFPFSLIIMGLFPDHQEEKESYLLGGGLSFLILGGTIEVFAHSILSSVGITRKTLIIRPGGIFLRFFTASKTYPFSEYLFYLFLENGEPVMADIYNLEKEIQAHVYSPGVLQTLLRIAQHKYLPNFHLSKITRAPFVSHP
ncbi:MAG: hypothetical protein HY036_09995 [Nitrospirae bacterium]|nr:hypothetical protein [Nitrospirota bacterium]MBI3352896.1 hypothetical protein [Nitrospirota bacterium]